MLVVDSGGGFSLFNSTLNAIFFPREKPGNGVLSRKQ